MRRLISIILMTLAIVSAAQPQENTATIEIDAPSQLIAGDSIEIQVTVTGALEGETVEAVLLNGVTIHARTLTLGTGGVAVWALNEGQITQAGTSLLQLTYGDVSTQHNIEVMPQDIDAIEAFTSSNSVMAYGDGETRLIVLLSDRYGNPILQQRLSVQATSPQGETRTRLYEVRDGLGDFPIISIGTAGILRLRVAAFDVERRLTLVQRAAEPANMDMTISPRCVLADGVTTVTLTTVVTDNRGNVVTDGTLINFSWDNGQGSRASVNGMASLTFPAFSDIGMYKITAQAGEQQAHGHLRVSERCP